MNNIAVKDFVVPEMEHVERVDLVQELILKSPEALIGDSEAYLEKCPLTHRFGEGCYIREIFLPAGMVFVTKIHKKTHPYFVMRGVVSVATDKGSELITGPFSGITQAGTRRVIYVHEDTVWTTVHVTDETDVEKIEKEVIMDEEEYKGLIGGGI
jgi:hypothetical protein